MDEKEEGERSAQDLRVGLRLALCGMRPRDSQQRVMILEPEAQGGGLCRKVKDAEAHQAPGSNRASTAHRLGLGKRRRH